MKKGSWANIYFTFFTFFTSTPEVENRNLLRDYKTVEPEPNCFKDHPNSKISLHCTVYRYAWWYFNTSWVRIRDFPQLP